MYNATQRVRSRNSGSSALNKSNFSETMTDWEVPHFHKLRDQGVLLNHPMDKWRYDTASWFGSVTTTRARTRRAPPYETQLSNYVTNKPSFFFASVGTHPAWVTTGRSNIEALMTTVGISFPGDSDINHAITEVSSRIGSGVAQYWVTLAESRKTIGMLCKALRLLRTPVRSALRALKLSAQSLKTQSGRIAVWKKASEIWLEARYGWRPFIYDAMAHWDANIASRTANQRLTKVKVVDSCETTLTDRKWFDYLELYPLAAHAAVDVYLQRYVKTGQTADFNAMVTGPLRVFGLYDIAGTAWELIPFSWVVDKFINLGNVAQALQACLLVDERIGWTTKVEIASVSQPRTIVTAPGPSYTPLWKWTYVQDDLASHPTGELEKYTGKTRTTINSFTPVLGLEGDLDFAEYLDLLALFRVLRS